MVSYGGNEHGVYVGNGSDDDDDVGDSGDSYCGDDFNECDYLMM